MTEAVTAFEPLFFLRKEADYRKFPFHVSV
jgi:hypothetical protein